MHASEREAEILKLLNQRGFVSSRRLCSDLNASTATIRRDLSRLEADGRIARVRGGARTTATTDAQSRLVGAPFDYNRARNVPQKMAIGRAAAALCLPGESIIIDGGTTALQMCAHLDGLDLQVLTNSLHIVSELLQQPTTRVSVPGGAIFREQSIILSPFNDDGLARHHASKMFMGAAAIGERGLMQADVVLIQAERKLMERANKLIVLVDSTKFRASASFLVCDLDRINTIVTDCGTSADDIAMLRRRGIDVVIAN